MGARVCQPETAGTLGTISNQVSGTAAGPVVQAGVIYGGLHVHEATTPRVVPHQLPGTSRGFVNRSASRRAALTRRLNPAQRDSGNVVISVIDGPAGIGKTALALHWAHSVRDYFPDGQLYVNLRGFDPAGRPLTSAEALQVLLEGLGVSPDGTAPGLVDSGVGGSGRVCGLLIVSNSMGVRLPRRRCRRRRW